MKPLITLAILSIFSIPMQAQFSGAYATLNWQVNTPVPSTGSVNTASAPASITINGSNDSEGGLADAYTDYTITATTSGAWSFDWNYSVLDGFSSFDPAFVIINGVETLLTDDPGFSNVQSGTFNGTAVAGDVIGFRILAIENCCGQAFLTVSNFVAPGGVLPVKLTSFTAKTTGKQIQLSWLTATETNSDRYEIERSADGKTFEKIGTVKAAGNTAQAQQYAFMDMAPVNNANYYRLRQVDKDAQTTYSKTVVVKFAAANVTAYPNPAKDIININMGTLKVSDKETIGLYNMQGKLMDSRKAQAGTMQWNVSALAAGQYYFKVGNTTVPFIKK